MDDNNKVEYYLCFSYFQGLGPILFKKILESSGSIEKAYNSKFNFLSKIIGIELAKKFINFRDKFNTKDVFKILEQKNISVLIQEDKRFPIKLRQIKDSPICIYIKGNIDKHNFEANRLFSIVGSRRITSYGKNMAKMFAADMAENGWTVVSGMALGIDAQAHWGCLESKGKTIAVLGCGVDIVYPWSNRYLYDEILAKDGLIISEFPPGLQVRKGLFVSRNRLISGLSEGTLIIEGRKNSGSLITARLAAEQGKDVFACPGQITSELSKAPHILIKQGAKLVTEVEDILEEYNLTKRKKNMDEKIYELLEKDEMMVYSELLNENKTVDMLCKSIGLGVYEIMPLLTSLELKNFVKMNNEGYYEVVNY